MGILFSNVNLAYLSSININKTAATHGAGGFFIENTDVYIYDSKFNDVSSEDLGGILYGGSRCSLYFFTISV